MGNRTIPRKYVLSTAVGGVVCLVALSVVPPQDGQTLLTVARVGSTVRLHEPGITFSFWPLAARHRIPIQGGRAVVPARCVFSDPEGSEMDVNARLEFEGGGRLPFDAGAIGRKGLEVAIGEWLVEKLPPPEEMTGLWKTSDLWLDIFGEESGGERADATKSVAESFDDVKLVELEFQPGLDPEPLRRAARAELARRTDRSGRLVVLGLDALDWRLLDQLMARGLMPNLQRLVSGGAHAVLDVPPPLISPVVWTTIATGVPPEVHGVLDFLEPDPEGGVPHPVSSNSCKATTLWRMVAAADRSVSVIGWWATFPAVAPDGCTIYSDRLTEQLIGMATDSPEIADPPEATARARDLVVRGTDVTPQMLAPYLDVAQSELDALRRSDLSEWDDPVGALAKLVAATITVERLTQLELDRGTEVILSYLEGTDVVGHLYAPYRPPPLPGSDPAEARRFGPVVDRYYAHVDGWIGEVFEQLGDSDTLVLVSDHGFHWFGDRPRMDSGTKAQTAVWWHRVEGAFLAYGPGIRHTPVRERLGLMDITPTLLALAGLPPAEEMTGSVHDWLWSSGERATSDVERRVHYAALLPVTGQRRVELTEEAREEELAKLRALGYLAPTEQPATTAQPRDRIYDRTEARRLNNLGTSRGSSDDKAGAEEAYRQAIAIDPSYAPSYHNLGVLLRRQEKLEESDRAMWKAIELGIGDHEMMVVRMALDYRQRGDFAKARSTFARGREMFPDSVMIWLNSGVFLGERGLFVEASECLERAVQLAPKNVNAWLNYASSHLELGNMIEARKALTRAAELAPDDERIRRQLAEIGGPLK